MTAFPLPPDLVHQVESALREDIGSGDITAELIPATRMAVARVISREPATISGLPWVKAVFNKVDPSLELTFFVNDGETIEANQPIFDARGKARSLLTAERAALNFLQTLSGTASICQRYAAKVAHTPVKLLDTRKTLPGLRTAQKYAVLCGGCYNHRIGLYDAFLIKENHIMACGSIASAVSRARELAPGKPVEVEVESLQELEKALDAGADTIMLDNFSLDDMKAGVGMADGKAKLEASGGITDESLSPIAETGVDFISIGALTKDCKAIDLSMRLVEEYDQE